MANKLIYDYDYDSRPQKANRLLYYFTRKCRNEINGSYIEPVGRKTRSYEMCTLLHSCNFKDIETRQWGQENMF